MFQKEYIVFDIGSSSIVALCVEKAPNKTFKINYKLEKKYHGYSRQQFNDPIEVQDIVTEMISEIERNVSGRTRDVLLGVPAEFCVIDVEDRCEPLSRKHKVKEEDIRPLYNFKAKEGYECICNDALYFVLENGEKRSDIIGEQMSKINARMLYGYCKSEIGTIIVSKFEHRSFNVALTISSLLMANYILPFEERKNMAMLVDVGYTSTSYMLSHYKGLEALISFSFGGVKINDELMNAFQISEEDADKLKNRAVLTRVCKDDACYKYDDIASGKTFSATVVNDIIIGQIAKLAKVIKRCIDASGIVNVRKKTLYLTGGGISYIRGVKDILSYALDINVEIVAPDVPEYNKPHLSSRLSLCNLVVHEHNENKK